jgi:CBS domain-containing protein
MKYPTVESVMTAPAITTSPGTPFKHLVTTLTDYGISALPVVEAGRLVGVVSEADLMRKEELRNELDRAPLIQLGKHRVHRRKARAGTAAELMTSPVVTITRQATVVQAANLLTQANVRRLFVVDDDGRLAGVLARRDVLRLFLRQDEEIRELVERDVLRRVLWADLTTVRVEVTDGVVTLTGRLDRRSEVLRATRVTRALPGVVEVVNTLTYDLDDIDPGTA